MRTFVVALAPVWVELRGQPSGIGFLPLLCSLCSKDWTQGVRQVSLLLSHLASPSFCFKGLEKEKSRSLAPWFGKGRVVFRGSFGGLSLTPPSCSSSCWEQSEGGIMFLLVTLPRMRGNPQSVEFGGGVGIGGSWWDREIKLFYSKYVEILFLESYFTERNSIFPLFTNLMSSFL